MYFKKNLKLFLKILFTLEIEAGDCLLVTIIGKTDLTWGKKNNLLPVKKEYDYEKQ